MVRSMMWSWCACLCLCLGLGVETRIVTRVWMVSGGGFRRRMFAGEGMVGGPWAAANRSYGEMGERRDTN